MGLERRVLELLKDLGVKQGQVVLDFGCGAGTYAIPAARIVGKGKVYALDKNKGTLDELMHKAELAGICNLERKEQNGERGIDLPDRSVDTVLLFDVLHSYYFPRTADRRKLLEEVRRICKKGARVLVYPKHMESGAKAEIEKAGFRFEREYSGTIIHDSRTLEEDKIWIFAIDEELRLGKTLVG
jgi:ubiquinone/menaquinone biosynthesis C-methylase UbiE